jgi:hypothetical protein
VEGWIPIVIKGCLEGMGELEEDSTPLWLEADVSHPVLYLPRLITEAPTPSRLMIPQMTHTRKSMNKHWIG